MRVMRAGNYVLLVTAKKGRLALSKQKRRGGHSTVSWRRLLHFQRCRNGHVEGYSAGDPGILQTCRGSREYIIMAVSRSFKTIFCTAVFFFSLHIVLLGTVNCNAKVSFELTTFWMFCSIAVVFGRTNCSFFCVCLE